MPEQCIDCVCVFEEYKIIVMLCANKHFFWMTDIHDRQGKTNIDMHMTGISQNPLSNNQNNSDGYNQFSANARCKLLSVQTDKTHAAFGGNVTWKEHWNCECFAFHALRWLFHRHSQQQMRSHYQADENSTSRISQLLCLSHGPVKLGTINR